MKLSWYANRLRSMDMGEVAWRVRNIVLQSNWHSRMGRHWPLPATVVPYWAGASVAATLPDSMPIDHVVATAESVLAGRWTVFGKAAPIAGNDPDWFVDPMTGRHAPSQTYCFGIPHRDEDQVGNVRTIWEISRLHHVTLLAAAFRCTGRSAFADRAIAHLLSWWQANPPLCGIHWLSGIELGLRLIAWVWLRRLLDGYTNIDAVFERSETFQQQLHAHQTWIASFYSRGSSANNHLIAEMVGLLTAAGAFPLFRESAAWARFAAERLEHEITKQTFPDGMNRELASGYHVFVLELLLIAGLEADAAGAPLSDAYWSRLRDMGDALAAVVDARLQTICQGDGDDARALVLESPAVSPVHVVLALCARLFGSAAWWPAVPQTSVTAALLGSLVRCNRPLDRERRAARPSWFPDAGIAILRDLVPGPQEIWCRLDAGPHGFLTTAAHAHADALSFELRLGGRPILVDPGTYCYHGEQAWRDYFLSTIGHNALELDGRDQAVHVGPFLWRTQPTTKATKVTGLDDGELACVEAFHDGYYPSGNALTYRQLSLNRRARALELLDWIEGSRPLLARLAFHMHPDVMCDLAGCTARLSWTDGTLHRSAELRLPAKLKWSIHCGEANPILGWYSPHFGCKVPTRVLLGVGNLIPGMRLRTMILFTDHSHILSAWRTEDEHAHR